MTIKEQIASGIKSAMKAQDKIRLNAFRNISATFLEFEKEKANNVVTDEVALSILSKLEKKRKESIVLYRQGNRPELAQQEQDELEIIQSLLPQKMSNQELEEIVSSVITANGFSGRKDLGQVMKIVLKDHAGKVDGNDVRKIAEKNLETAQLSE